MVQKGNPKRIQTLTDLVRKEVNFINRQRGAGTRVLLDYHLNKLGISTGKIAGYDQEEYTHLAVAAAVDSRRADCGLGIASAADALGLDFLPQFTEIYEIIIPENYLDDLLIEEMLTTARKPQFQQRIMNLPGYTIENMGEIRTIV
jgi:putative molybdopterin biosynthesis protein